MTGMAENAAARLREAGVPLAREATATCLDQVAEAFQAVDAERVALKAAGLLHKSDRGGVTLNLTTVEEAERAAATMLANLGEEAMPLVLQEQCEGLEMLVGLRRTAELGAAIVVGLGGVHTEIHRDIAYTLAPVSRAEALDVLRGLRSWPLLKGYRGGAPCDVDALCDVVVAVGDLGLRDENIAELDLNPVIVRGDGQGCVTVDARIIPAPAPPPRPRARRNLDRLMKPEHIAVVGVSDDEHKVGTRLFRYLVDHGFSGRLDPVHPAGGTVRGHPRATRLAHVGGSPDLVCVAVPAEAVPEVAQQAVELGVGGMIVHSSGFAEVGPEGAALQHKVVDTLRHGDVPMAGPNSMGIVAPGHALAASISGGLELPELPMGGIALLASSGALSSCLASRLMGNGAGLSHWVHAGNEADLVIADYLEWLVEDSETQAIGLLLEDVKDGPRLVDAGRALLAAGKPIYAYNMVRSPKAQNAALSHTGAMVGPHELREAVLREAGIVSVPSLRVLEDALWLSTSDPLPDGQSVAVVTFSGGASTIIADEADRWGIDLPELSSVTAERVGKLVPSFAAIRNPLDVSYQMLTEPERFRQVVEALLADREFDAVLVQFTTNADPYAVDSAESVVYVRERAEVPVYVSRYGAEQLAPNALRTYRRAGIPVLDAPDRAAQAIGAVMHAARQLRAHDPAEQSSGARR